MTTPDIAHNHAEIKEVHVNVADVARSVDYYTRHIGALVVGEVTDEGARLDLVTAHLVLTRIEGAVPTTWERDDLQRGFRHIGFKVDAVDARIAAMRAAGADCPDDPFDAEGGVRIVFFTDPDGTVLEFVQGDLQYHEIHDADGVAMERALGVPQRPRFDHVAVTVASFEHTEAFYGNAFGYRRIGSLAQPHDPRGFAIDFLKGGDSVLEIFTYEAESRDRAPQLDATGFTHVTLAGHSADPAPPAAAIAVGHDAAGRAVHSDSDGFLFAVAVDSR